MKVLVHSLDRYGASNPNVDLIVLPDDVLSFRDETGSFNKDLYKRLLNVYLEGDEEGVEYYIDTFGFGDEPESGVLVDRNSFCIHLSMEETDLVFTIIG